MRNLIYIFLIVSSVFNAQDKLYFKSGVLKKCYLLSVTKDKIYYKNYDTSTYSNLVNKADLVMLETYNGIRYLFSEKENTKLTTIDTLKLKQNTIGIQPFNFLLGRLTFNYERLSKNNKVGLMIPLSITFNPFASLYKGNIDTTQTLVSNKKGTNIISGFDVNFYLGKKQNSKYFIGPRFRYGTDLFATTIEAYTLQTQFGIKFQKPSQKQLALTQHLSAGFGFIRIVSLPFTNRINPKQSYIWYSLNYRIGFGW